MPRGVYDRSKSKARSHKNDPPVAAVTETEAAAAMQALAKETGVGIQLKSEPTPKTTELMKATNGRSGRKHQNPRPSTKVPPQPVVSSKPSKSLVDAAHVMSERHIVVLGQPGKIRYLSASKVEIV